ncbi:hypothetical protein EV424DRAFT_1089124 [Suillus variegatus]|nr:hypothetical protein EV424DRAFT_1089124 [Suillus variegatus]
MANAHHTTFLRRLDLLVHHHFHCIAPSTSVVCDTMPFPFTLACRLLLLVIGICNVISIVILRPDIVARTAGPFEAVALASNIVALLVFLITFSFLCCRRHAESSNTRNIATFGTLWLSDVTSCVLLTIHARQNHATALCHDLSQSGDCTMANVLLAIFYMASIFALVGLVLASCDKHPGITKVSPRYPITKAASSHFAAFQHPLDVELENAYPKSSSKKAEHIKEGRTHERWTEIPL